MLLFVYRAGMSQNADDQHRPEPDTLLRPRPRSQEDWAKAAAKAARLTVMQRAKGRKRAALGGYPERPSRERLLEGYRNAPRCTAQKRDGTRCRNPVVRGSDRCASHEGVQRNPSCPAAGRWYLEGKLKLPRGRYKTHQSALRAALDREAGDKPSGGQGSE